jgi:GMP synthase-like glutamine amidotransferase
MIASALGDQHDYVTYDAESGELPAPRNRSDGFIITGSSASVTDRLPWILRLEDWLRENRKPVIGLCFGHQVMASAFGGRVERSAKGWGWGIHTYHLLERPAWIGAISTSLALAAAHEDQVTELGASAFAVAGNAFCPLAIIHYDDRPAISVQGHPEFSLEFERALIERRFDLGLMSKEEAATALSTLADKPDAGLFWTYVNEFLAAHEQAS